MVLDRNSRLRFLLIEDSTPDSELVQALLEDEFPNAKIDVATSLELALKRLGRPRRTTWSSPTSPCRTRTEARSCARCATPTRR